MTVKFIQIFGSRGIVQPINKATRCRQNAPIATLIATRVKGWNVARESSLKKNDPPHITERNMRIAHSLGPILLSMLAVLVILSY